MGIEVTGFWVGLFNSIQFYLYSAITIQFSLGALQSPEPETPLVQAQWQHGQEKTPCSSRRNLKPKQIYFMQTGDVTERTGERIRTNSLYINNIQIHNKLKTKSLKTK